MCSSASGVFGPVVQVICAGQAKATSAALTVNTCLQRVSPSRGEGEGATSTIVPVCQAGGPPRSCGGGTAALARISPWSSPWSLTTNTQHKHASPAGTRPVCRRTRPTVLGIQRSVADTGAIGARLTSRGSLAPSALDTVCIGGNFGWHYGRHPDVAFACAT